ncbi:hypothetical protein [Halorubrum tibetense]|uniref:Uncharacterized protein n=1 Tax=Halorubrum tibetense TaxID=175631 RepID=A0ABD5S6L0_9EURY
MELSPDEVEAAIEAYRSSEPLYTVESESIEGLPRAFRRGEYGRRDAQWVVRWFGRRYLGEEPPGFDRTHREERFEGADFEAVRDAIDEAVAADRDEFGSAVDALTSLPGVDFPIASAFLAFANPEVFVVVDRRTWQAAQSLTDLEGAYPDPPNIEQYEAFLDTCHVLADRYGVGPWEVYMFLWRHGAASTDPE